MKTWDQLSDAEKLTKLETAYDMLLRAAILAGPDAYIYDRCLAANRAEVAELKLKTAEPKL